MCDGFIHSFVCLGAALVERQLGGQRESLYPRNINYKVRVKGGRDLEGRDLKPGLAEKETDQTRRCWNCSQAPGGGRRCQLPGHMVLAPTVQTTGRRIPAGLRDRVPGDLATPSLGYLRRDWSCRVRNRVPNGSSAKTFPLGVPGKVNCSVQ